MPSARPVRSSSRDAILEAAALVLSENPGASLAEVAVRAGVGRATLHRHFASREALIHKLTEDALDATDRATAHLYEAASGREALEEMFEAVIPLGARFHFLSRVPASDLPASLNARYQQQLDGTTELIGVLKAEGEIDTSIPASWAVAVIDSLIWAGWEAVKAGNIAPREVAKLACRTALQGLRPNDGDTTPGGSLT